MSCCSYITFGVVVQSSIYLIESISEFLRYNKSKNLDYTFKNTLLRYSAHGINVHFYMNLCNFKGEKSRQKAELKYFAVIELQSFLPADLAFKDNFSKFDETYRNFSKGIHKLAK